LKNVPFQVIVTVIVLIMMEVHLAVAEIVVSVWKQIVVILMVPCYQHVIIKKDNKEILP
jgi:hypothetical protein